MNIAIKKINYKEGVISIGQLKRLLRLVPKAKKVKIVELHDDLPASGIAHLSQMSGALDFLNDPREDVYTLNDLKVRYR